VGGGDGQCIQILYDFDIIAVVDGEGALGIVDVLFVKFFVHLGVVGEGLRRQVAGIGGLVEGFVGRLGVGVVVGGVRGMRGMRGGREGGDG